MCRLLAYVGPDISLNRLIFEPEHGLEKQAWQPRELREARLNADGFGIGWYNNKQAMRYRQPIPIWNDPNLEDLSHTLNTDLVLAMVRSATPGLGTHHYNTQPYRYNQWMFMHNGYIRNFSHSSRPQLRQILDHEFESNIQGSTDSEYIFALILHYMREMAVNEAVRATFNTLGEILGDESALLNIMLTDGEYVYAARYAVNGESPSMYYGQGVEGYEPNSQMLSSEPLTSAPQWEAVDDNQLVIISRHQPATRQTL